MVQTPFIKAKTLSTSAWINTPTQVNLDTFQGNVIIIYVFQMLCPACVQHSLMQARNLDKLFKTQNLQVLGLHSVFEHHEVMNEAALQVFCQEFQLNFPIGIDQACSSGLPKTMKDYAMQGTPTFIAIDKQGRLRLQHFGHIPDLEVGSIVGRLLAE